MFCGNCGEKLNAANQKFCHNCGSDIKATSNATGYKTQRIQGTTAPKIYYAPIQQQTQIRIGRAGKYSKLSLWLALASIIMGIVTILVGYNLYRFSYLANFNFIVMIVVMIVILILRVGGLTMGILAKINSSKADIFEPYNDIQKAGNILSIIGIIVNGIALALSFIGPYSIFNMPLYGYYY